MKSVRALALVCLLGLIAVAGFAVAPAHAVVDLKGMFGKQAPVSDSDRYRAIYPIQNENDFEPIAKSYHGTPYNDPQIEFEIMIPKDWVPVEMSDAHSLSGANNKLIGDLVHFRSPVIAAMRADVTVQVVKLPQDISAENWLKGFILSNKYNLQGTVKPVNEKKAGAECVETNPDGSSSYTYITAQINANNAVIVRFDSPLQLKDVLAFIRKRIVDSFRFILETDQPIEPLKSFNFSTALKFRYPESLVVSHVDVGDTRSMSAWFTNQSKPLEITDRSRGKFAPQTLGLMRFVVVKRSHNTSLKKETEDMHDFVTKNLDLDFKKLVSYDKVPVSNRFLFSRYEIYQVIPKKSNPIPEEIRFVALGDRNWYVLGLLFTPSESEDFYNWAVNTQYFDMIIRDFR